MKSSFNKYLVDCIRNNGLIKSRVGDFINLDLKLCECGCNPVLFIPKDEEVCIMVQTKCGEYSGPVERDLLKKLKFDDETINSIISYNNRILNP